MSEWTWRLGVDELSDLIILQFSKQNIQSLDKKLLKSLLKKRAKYITEKLSFLIQ